MNNDPREEPRPDSKNQSTRDKQILGLATDELAGLSVDELTGNKTAITMVMHYYKVLLEENISLRNDLNTARTYVEGYGKKKTNSSIGAVLLLVANVGVGFGVNLLTANQTWPGLATLVPGLCMAAAGMYFSTKDR
jgi:hypothetical protein